MDLNFKLMAYQMVNFLVLMVIITFLFNKFIRPFMHKRSEGIKKGLEDIEAGRKELEVLKEQYHASMLEVKRSAHQEIDKAVIEGNQMRESIITRAEKESLDLVERSRREIEREKEKAISAVRNEVVSLSMQAASRILKREVDEKQNSRLVEDFIEEMKKEPKVLSE
jgi:F-type H+-transporting ATPase subunit b